MNPAKWFLSRLKNLKANKGKDGFTLIELLVGITLAFLVITPLMTFMISIMDNDRKEQAKSNEDQELTAALNYIKQDLQQAVYIYDADGIKSIRKYLPEYSNKDQYFPVLVFWKRQFIPKGLTVNSSSNSSDDTFVYALVAYYLVNDGDPNNNGWSKTSARIYRFQINDGYGNSATLQESTRSQNFKLFDLSISGSNLKDKMDQWTSSDGTDTYQEPLVPLVDHIDATPTGSGNNSNGVYNNPIPGSSSASAPPACPTSSNTSLPMQMVPDFPQTTGGDALPPSATSSNTSPNTNTTGFYVCVHSSAGTPEKSVAEIHLRGNSYSLLQENTLNYDVTNSSISIYFPQKTTRVETTGNLSPND